MGADGRPGGWPRAHDRGRAQRRPVAATVIRARQLRRAYGDRQAVAGIDFDVRAGECFGFLGPNGAGKSTTMRMLSCLTPRDGGELTVLGLDPAVAPRELKRRLGVVAQDINLDLELSVRQNILIYGRYFDVPRVEAAARADHLLAAAGLAERGADPVSQLSGGMRRRLQIVRALVNDPRLILLDEPTTGLDPQARHMVWERLRALGREGVAVVITTHYMDEAAQLCDRLVVMDRGRIIRQGSPADLVRDVVGPEALEVEVEGGTDRPEIERALAGLGLQGHRRGPRTVIFAPSASKVESALRARGLPLGAVTSRPTTLEDVFLDLTGHNLDDDPTDGATGAGG